MFLPVNIGAGFAEIYHPPFPSHPGGCEEEKREQRHSTDPSYSQQVQDGQLGSLSKTFQLSQPVAETLIQIYVCENNTVYHQYNYR